MAGASGHPCVGRHGLIKATLDAGAPDNVTVVIVEGFSEAL